MNLGIIIESYEHKDIKNLKRLRKKYKEALNILLEKDFSEYKKEFPLDRSIDVDSCRIYLNLKIKACNEYIKLLNKGGN